ncbi:MAG: radical SAM protein [Limisphaerales bacterium]
MRYDLRVGDLTARGAQQAALHELAVAEASRRFGRRVFVRGVVEVSNFCRENCHYCGMRRDNRTLARARAQHDELADLLVNRRPVAITDVTIQSGEDPVAAREVVLPLVRTLHRQTNLGISVCLGTHDSELYAEIKAAGASIYIMKFETADPRRYDNLAAPGSLAKRLAHIRQLAAGGWMVSSGFIVGLPGEDAPELMENCRLARELPLRSCSVSPFVPGRQTPLAGAVPGGVETTLNCMAILRLMRPDWVIPAVSALNLAQPRSGYRRGLRAGANLVTINLTPRDLQREYLIYDRDRCIMDEERVMTAIVQERLEPSTQSLAEYFGNGSAHRGREAATVDNR